MTLSFHTEATGNVKRFPAILRSGSASHFLQIRPVTDGWLLEEVNFPIALPVGYCRTRGEARRTAREWTDRGIPALFLA